MAKKPAYRAGRDQAATAENVELLTGQRGDRLDKAVTFRELTALGLSTLRPGPGGVYVPGKNPDLFPPGQMEFPHAPVNVIANGAFHTVLVEWDSPRYRGHSHAEIWRAEQDNPADAVLVGTTSANLFSDAIGKGAKFYYWVRFVNGKDDRGPFQGVNGVVAETSRDVQDILDELQGKIEKSHLVQELLKPIEAVPQLQLDVTILKPKVDEIEVIRPKVDAIENKIPSIEQELAGLDERQKVAQDLLDDAQQQLGNSSIEIGLVQDRLNAKLDKYKGDFDSFRDAVFVVDPETGSITMDAVNAVRDELHTSITEVHQGLDAVAGQITSKADNVTVDGQGKRITEAEQRINGLDASLSQTVTKGEFTEEQKKVTEIGQELNATKGELSQKATQQEVDAQGERLANAESKLTVHTDELSSQAQRLDGLTAQVKQGDETLQASITDLARVTAESDRVTAQRVSGLEVRAGDSEAKIQALEEIIEDDGGITAGRFDSITAELDLQRGQDDDNASATIEGALSGDERERESRKAFGSIRTEQKVILTEQQAQAQRITDMNVKFEAKDATTQARISTVEKVTSDADSALSQRIDNITADYKDGDAKANASIKALEQSSASADEALSLRQDQLAAELSTTTAELAASISQEGSARVTADEAISKRVTEVVAQFSGELEESNARISAEELARTTKDEALAQQIHTVDAEFKAADTALSASLSESSKALADADKALGERISTIDVKVGENSASITELQRVVVSNEESLSQRQDKMESEVDVGAISQVEGALAGDERDRENRKARGVILQQQSTLANQQEAQARTVEQLTAEFGAANADIKAQITNEQLVRSTADEALSQRISVVDAGFKAADKVTNSAVSDEVRARSDADSALSERVTRQEAAYKDADSAISGRIDREAQARSDADGALSRVIEQVTSDFKSADKQLTGQITSESEARATADGALGKRIDTVTAKAGDLEAAVQQQSEAISTLEGGAQAMWAAKAQAGDIKAGIGIVAKNDGTSQIAMSASQVFVFNPNSATPMAPLFAIDNGQVVIAEAIIRKATIQILNSEKITADYVKAGVSLSAPFISGAVIDMGNGYMSGGAAGFGKGGPYGGWSWTWHTIIYADGSIYTDRLYAANGTFTGTVNANSGVLNNVTINENCIIRGTLDADRIVGDVTTLIKPSGNFSIAAYKRARNIVCIKPIAGNAVVSGSGTIGIILICKMNGVEQGRSMYQGSYPAGINRIPMRVSLQEAFVIPGNINASITFEIVPYGSVSNISEQYVESGSVWLMGLF
ncbi:phage tail tip fiber protein [Aeromonas aquatica]|uniref:phage tail tip fiber protein n=1 Tax=Aeromonas aquatica TaxID=558964 RepID=UPI00051AFE31|nr:DUF1983 domain-containing protein [Aeromonas aquatica]